MEPHESTRSSPPGSPYHWVAQALASVFAYDLDPSRPLLSPPGNAAHRVEMLELPVGSRTVPAIRFTPHASNGAGICFTHAAGAPQVLPYFRLIREMLRAGYTVLYYELDGHGRNPHPLAASDVLAVVPAAIRVMRQEFARVSLVGMSLGAVLSLRAAATRPDVDAMVLLSPPLRVILSDWELFSETLGPSSSRTPRSSWRPPSSTCSPPAWTPCASTSAAPTPCSTAGSSTPWPT